MSNKFIIIGAPRTGSTLLVRTLDSIDGICCHGELLADRVRGFQDGFDPGQASKAERDARLARLSEERDADPTGFILRALDCGSVAGGFKALYSALLDPRWQDVGDALVELPVLKVIHLVRHNSLRRFVSDQVMQSGGANHSGAGGRGDIRLKVDIDIDAFQRVTAELEAQGARLLERFADKPILPVSYEQLAANTSDTVLSVCRFLGIGDLPNEIAPALSKVGAADLRDSVSNYQALLDHPATRDLVEAD